VSDALVHPSADALSDRRSDLLDPDVSRRIDDHVARCDRCRAQLDALDAAVGRLRDVGRDLVPMPPDVASRIETALAAEVRQRAAVVPMRRSDQPDRAADESGPAAADRHRRRSLILVAAGTVAVLAIGGVTADRFLTGGRTGTPTAGSDSSVTRNRPGAAKSGQLPTKTPRSLSGGAANDALAIDRANFESIAPIAITTGAGAGRSSLRCFGAAVRGYNAHSWLSASVDWRGVRAWLLYDPAHSRGVVVDCATGPRIMYQHQF
jgi:hypothetical protein